ncbi:MULTISPECIES: tRNA (adenosine(37)-N6)-dimethylallyltransferase MiaA [unclassified Siphonobacter]|uniref:tRNA (adenosine(37)-N6)-dimethylallyltransferase MiaA n=1 Tax=unclassified Siphonobacter TaxID=2635712 RepID=UPI000CBA3D64|nr:MULTISPECIES: tRNA (adenosine(37)-N6)-dimethylallyltransferase MiaA [unclassified Siphonobacter]MDQ1086348.1 tRNA dimethylallyltransferase [Siphonobacter sp. SORGH_AS_1065]PKK35440.1 tRNA (adenosine(37)-N6)-dimethylallyltransferase MiaA [Siphonobacter sp. SORGH_AS_0500]
MKVVIVIAGPTAVGKTELCVKLAQELNTEIVSADSRQFYKELSIGTAKPTAEEMQGIRHHFIDSHSIQDYFSVGDFERECLQTLEAIFSRKDVVILTGGSGLFLKTITDGLDEMPEVDLSVREELMQRFAEQGITPLVEELRRLDPAYFEYVDRNNTQRIVRALEVCLSTGKPYSSFRTGQKAKRPFEVIKICLTRDREVLYDRINRRVNLMMEAGLINEVKSVTDYREHYALKTVGYQEVFEYFDGTYDSGKMVEKIQQNSRRYAKRQLTWFRHQGDFQWFEASDYEGVKAYILDQLAGYRSSNA